MAGNSDSVSRAPIGSVERAVTDALVDTYGFMRGDLESGRVQVHFDYQSNEGGGLEVTGDVPITILLEQGFSMARERGLWMPDAATVATACTAFMRGGIYEASMPAGTYGCRSMWGEPEIVEQMVDGMIASAHDKGVEFSRREMDAVTQAMACACRGMDEICDALFEIGERVHDSQGMSAIKAELGARGFEIADDGRVSFRGRDLNLALSSRGRDWYLEGKGTKGPALMCERDDLGHLAGFMSDDWARHQLDNELKHIALTGETPDIISESLVGRVDALVDEMREVPLSSLSPAEVESVWAEFGDVAVDENGCLEGAWREYPAGTDRVDIWHDFDEAYPDGVGALMFPDNSRGESSEGLRSVDDVIAGASEAATLVNEHAAEERDGLSGFDKLRQKAIDSVPIY